MGLVIKFIVLANIVSLNLTQHYPSLGSFLDPQFTKEGKPYGPIRYKEIVKERYLISKNMNTSYNEIGQITPIERKYIMEFIIDEIKKSNELVEKRKNEARKNKGGR